MRNDKNISKAILKPISRPLKMARTYLKTSFKAFWFWTLPRRRPSRVKQKKGFGISFKIGSFRERNRVSKWVVIPLLATTIFFLSMMTQAYADEGDEGFKEEKRQEMYKMLNVSGEQEEQMKAHRQKQRGGMKAHKEKIRQCKEELHTELRKLEVDVQKVKNLNEKIKELQGKMLDQRLDGALGIRKILTPEQYQKFSQRMDERRKKKMERKK